MDGLIMKSNVVYTDSKISKEKASFAPAAGYDSGWVDANNQTNHNMAFTHGLGRSPTQVTVLFSPDQETSYPLQWSWNPENSGSPVTIWFNDHTVQCSIWNGSSLHGAWNGATGQWTNWSTGYLRVFAS
ncbi:hypothetical protein [Collimonas sp. PA-H2]|uniref:hypothetical protein n=1 Tax=Collimonas sp. PA-H2 TaxID=1881062 RepID=UPI00130453B5|nr:hypothetical protein [Collimonas sp. PA-H2]